MRRAFAPVVIAVALSGCGINSVPTSEENAKARWADVQAAYQRRADLIPNLVATAKAAAGFEERTLTGITQARAGVQGAQLSGDDLTDQNKVQQFAAAQNALGLALRPLQEAYPQLQSQGNFKTLMDQLEGTENRITIARRDYNTAVQEYNTLIRTFPDAIGARVVHGAKPLVPFQASAGSEAAPKVDFG
jgi:LemA protein